MGKARGAAERIFEFVDYPSSINAVAMDEDKQFEDKIRIKNVEEI